jgi:hypothetical protein
MFSAKLSACKLLDGFGVLMTMPSSHGQMASDGCLPEFLLKTNRWRGTHHNIILVFFILASSQVSPGVHGWPPRPPTQSLPSHATRTPNRRPLVEHVWLIWPVAAFPVYA